MSGASEELPSTEVNVLKGHEGAVLAARFNGNGEYCLSCGKDRTIRLWNPHRGIHIKTYKSHGREVRDVHVTSYVHFPTKYNSQIIILRVRFLQINYAKPNIFPNFPLNWNFPVSLNDSLK